MSSNFLETMLYSEFYCKINAGLVIYLLTSYDITIILIECYYATIYTN